MNIVYLISGPCGCGKSTLSKLLAESLPNPYHIVGDSLAAGFCEKPALTWEQRLAMVWEGIAFLTKAALGRGLQVVVDYVVEDELTWFINELAGMPCEIYYLVLLPDEETVRQRLDGRGDSHMYSRSLFLREKLRSAPENQGHLLNNSRLTPEECLLQLSTNKERWRIAESHE